MFLVPFFYPRPHVTELPDEATVREHYRKWADLVDGMFYFGGAGTAPQLAASNAAYAKVLREAGKVCMCSFSPMYWGAAQPDRRYYETCGGEGIELQWKSIIRAAAGLGGDRHLERFQRELHLSGRHPRAIRRQSPAEIGSLLPEVEKQPCRLPGTEPVLHRVVQDGAAAAA